MRQRERIEAAKEVEWLEVYRDRERVGDLRRTKLGASFQYYGDYAQAHVGDEHRAIANRMPVREAAYEVRGVNLHPFFAGLLPEGLRMKALVQSVKSSEDDLFTQLVVAGGETVGDIWLARPGEEVGSDSTPIEMGRNLELSFDQALKRSLDWKLGGDPVAISGIQNKVSASMVSLPVRSTGGHKEFILKLPSPDHPRIVENEAFYMEVARSVGIETAESKLIRDDEGTPGLLVKRFDREPRKGKDGSPVKKLHQEDACQLLDAYPADKYRLSMREMAQALELCSAPLVARLRLLQLVAFSYLIGNGDLHAKNVSVLRRDGLTSLTPAYDLLSTLPYGDDTLALKVEGQDRRVKRKTLLAFGERVGVREAAVERMLNSLIKKVHPWIPRVDEIGFDAKKSEHMKRVMGQRLEELNS